MHLFTGLTGSDWGNSEDKGNGQWAMGSQVKFGRSQSGKVISESPESPNVHSSTGEIWRMYLQGEIPRTSRTQRQKYIHQKDIQKDGPKVLDGVGLEVATHRATPPGNPGLQSFRNMFSMPKCRHRNSEFRKSTKSSNLQVQLQSGFRFFSLNLKKNKSKPHGILPLHSPRYSIEQLHESPDSEPTADEHQPPKKTRKNRRKFELAPRS